MRTNRLARLEGAAAPRAVVLAWLAEAHAFATLSHHAEWMLGQPPDRWPFTLLPAQAAAHVRRAMREARQLDVLRAIDDAVEETVFLVELVLLVNAVTDRRQREAGLRCRLLVAEMRALALEPDIPDAAEPQAIEGRSSMADRLEAWFGEVSTRAQEVARSEEARRLLEHRYFDGYPTLFPGTADRWEAVRDAFAELASLATGVVEPTDCAHDRGTRDAAAMVEAGYLADEARAATLGFLGDTRGARAVMGRRLRTVSRASPK